MCVRLQLFHAQQNGFESQTVERRAYHKKPILTNLNTPKTTQQLSNVDQFACRQNVSRHSSVGLQQEGVFTLCWSPGANKNNLVAWGVCTCDMPFAVAIFKSNTLLHGMREANIPSSTLTIV